MIVVSDTTAITSLLKIDRAELLQQLFGHVNIPGAVRDELLRYHQTIPDFLTVESVKDESAVIKLCAEIDAGEAEAIILAEESGADALLIDEKVGRAIAERRGIMCLGLAGALLLAKENKLITSVAATLAELETEANFYLAKDLKRALLIRANEPV